MSLNVIKQPHFAKIKNPFFNFQEAEKKVEEEKSVEFKAGLLIFSITILAIAIIFCVFWLLGFDILHDPLGFKQWLRDIEQARRELKP